MPTTWTMTTPCSTTSCVLDFQTDLLDLHTASNEASSSSPQPLMTAEVSEHSGSKGMRDCGATCSAGPESSIKNLINAVLEQDKSARITVDRKRCPKFRYGSGKWGKAL